MAAGASAGSLAPKNLTTKTKSCPQSPIPELAEYLHTARGLEGSISFDQPLLVKSTDFHRNTQPLQVTASDITALVNALDDGTPNICCRLDDLAFQTTYSFLRISEPCLAKQRGHCLFAESLHPAHANTLPEKALLKVRKAELGKHVLYRLIKAFLDQTRHPHDRRWTGSLALELLRDCGRNRKILSTPDSDELRYGLGELVIVENHENLRLMAGTIIREMVDNGLSANQFWDPKKYPDLPSIFENILEKSSQWTLDFVTFVDSLETQGFVSKERKVSAFAYAVFFGGRVYNTRAGLSILVTFIDELTIIVPYTESDSARYIDIPPEHISAVHWKQGQPGSQPGDISRPTATVLSIDLRETTDAAYYVNEVAHESCQIVLAFDTTEEATFIKERIEESKVSQGDYEAARTKRLGTTSEDALQSTEMLSQSACIDISSYPGRRRGANHQHTGNVRSTQVINQLPPASERMSGLIEPANKESEYNTRNRRKGNHSGHAVGKSTINVLIATEVLDVSQESHQREERDRQGNDQKDGSDPEPTSSTAWRDGMQAIENAKELEYNGLDPAPKIGAGISTVDERDIVLDPDDNLYSATPIREKSHPDQATNDEVRQPPSVASVKSVQRTGRKLSRSMRVGEDEKSSGLPQSSKDKGNSGKNSRSSNDKTPASHTTLPGAHKRKSNVVDDASPSKKRKANKSNSQEASTGKMVDSETIKPATYDVFDIPSSPEQAEPKVGKSAGNKQRLSRDSAKTRVTAKTSKPANATSQPAKSVAKTKSPGVSKSTKTKQLNTSADTDWDQDLAIDTDDGRDSNVVAKNVRSGKNRSKNLDLTAVSKGRITEKSQSSKIKSQKTNAKDGVPSRSPRKPRVAAQKAKSKILAIKSGNGEGVESSQQGNSCAMEAPQDAASNLDEHPTDDNGVSDSSKTDIARKTQNNSNVKDSAGSDAKSWENADESTTSHKPDTKAENLVLTAQSAMKLRHSSSHNGQVPYSEEPSSLSTAIIEHQEAAQQIAPSESDSPLVIQEGLDTNEHCEVIHNASPREIETRNTVSKAPSPPTSDRQDPEVEDSHFQDAMAPLMIDTANLFVENHHALQEHAADINFGPQNNTHIDYTEGDTAAVKAMPIGDIDHKANRPSGKASGTDTRNSHDSVTAALQHAPKSVTQKEDSRFLDQSTDKATEDYNQSLSNQPQPEDPDNRRKTSHKGNVHTVADGKGSVIRDPLRNGAPLRSNEDPFKQILDPVIDEGVFTAEPVEDTSDLKNTRARINGSLRQQHHGEGVNKDGELLTRHSQRNVASEVSRSLTPHPSRSVLLPKASLLLETSHHEFNKQHAGHVADHDVVLSGILSDLPTISQARTSKNASQPLQEQSTVRKRPAETISQLQSKKRKLSPQATPTLRPKSSAYQTHKDPSRIPQVISFSAKGPRNQGIHSPAISLETPIAPQSPRVKQSASDGIHVHRKDVGTMTIGESYLVNHGRNQFGDPERSRVERQNGSAYRAVISEPTPCNNLRPGDKARNPLTDDDGDGLFAIDDRPQISSQSSRVMENGSPMPSKRTPVTRYEMKDPVGQPIGLSAHDGVNTWLEEDDTFFAYEQDDESPELGLPKIAGPGNTRKKQVGFIGSSNSKHGPSSPSAPSAMLTEVEVHMAEPSGHLVNVQTDEVLIPSHLQDPFANKESKQPTTFIEKLLGASNIGHEEERRPKAMEQHRGTRRPPDEEDPDETLVGIPTDRSKGRARESPTTASTDSTSESNHQSQGSERSNTSDAIYGRWRAALEPYQENMLTVLCEISHGLFGHIMDAETAINDVVKDYQRQGQRVIKNLADELERELGKYTEAVRLHRNESLKNYKALSLDVMKNLQRKSETEVLAVKLEERQKEIDEKMNAAFSLCGGEGDEEG